MPAPMVSTRHSFKLAEHSAMTVANVLIIENDLEILNIPETNQAIDKASKMVKHMTAEEVLELNIAKTFHNKLRHDMKMANDELASQGARAVNIKDLRKQALYNLERERTSKSIQQMHDEIHAHNVKLQQRQEAARMLQAGRLLLSSTLATPCGAQRVHTLHWGWLAHVRANALVACPRVVWE
jgi:hypothetical protein